ncbi:MAG TPA: hypothetical protein VHK67_07520 [Rhabdochlamydiaceae bacterium]|jgi:hypothetical protein|nr:hypothetical protein [Rhabdochlamydiaceae bacterium]
MRISGIIGHNQELKAGFEEKPRVERTMGKSGGAPIVKRGIGDAEERTFTVIRSIISSTDRKDSDGDDLDTPPLGWSEEVSENDIPIPFGQFLVKD